jgi:hypothetical protein
MQTNGLQIGLLDGSKINRLLLACQFDRSTAVAQLDPVILAISQTLPAIRLSLLTAESNAWLFCDPRYCPEAKVYGYSPVITSDTVPLVNTELQLKSLYTTVKQLTETLSVLEFDAALIFTQPQASPYSLAYLLYLAKIPIRVGQSSEFGGGVLSHSIRPSLDIDSPVAYHQHLLQVILP